MISRQWACLIFDQKIRMTLFNFGDLLKENRFQLITIYQQNVVFLYIEGSIGFMHNISSP